MMHGRKITKGEAKSFILRHSGGHQNDPDWVWGQKFSLDQMTALMNSISQHNQDVNNVQIVDIRIYYGKSQRTIYSNIKGEHPDMIIVGVDANDNDVPFLNLKTADQKMVASDFILGEGLPCPNVCDDSKGNSGKVPCS